MVSAHFPEMKPTGLADRLGRGGLEGASEDSGPEEQWSKGSRDST